MKYLNFLFVLLPPVLLYGCSKDSSDNNSYRAPSTTSTTGTFPTINSDRIYFDKDTISQLSKSQATVANHYQFKATHFTGDPILAITIYEASFPDDLPKTYSVTQSAITAGKCGITFTYSGRFYVANSGTVSITADKIYTLTNIICASSSDNQQRRLSGQISDQ